LRRNNFVSTYLDNLIFLSILYRNSVV